MNRIIEWITSILPANRIAAIIGFLTAVGAALVTLQTSFVPGSPPAEAIAKAITIVGALAGAMTIVLRFLKGSQQWDILQHGVNPVNGEALAGGPADAEDDGDDDGSPEYAPTEDELVGDYEGDPPDELVNAPTHEVAAATPPPRQTTRRTTRAKTPRSGK